MKQRKMSLADIQGKLSRAEMKKIMAGFNQCSTMFDWCDIAPCAFSDGNGTGACEKNTLGTKCYCVGVSIPPSKP
jgi:hypothetical protein